MSYEEIFHNFDFICSVFVQRALPRPRKSYMWLRTYSQQEEYLQEDICYEQSRLYLG